jgi:hypothetical protein
VRAPRAGSQTHPALTLAAVERCQEDRRRGEPPPAPPSEADRDPRHVVITCCRGPRRGARRRHGGTLAAPVRPWYSFRLGSWHLVALNSNCGAVDCTAEAAWLRADLATHPARCTLAYWHHPRFSSGHEGGTRAVGPLWDALYSARAELVLNGHDHDYERFGLQDPLGRPDPVNGLRELVVGTGGAPWLPFRTVAANSRIRGTGTFGVLRRTLQPGGYRWRFVHAAGAPFTDHGSGTCH